MKTTLALTIDKDVPKPGAPKRRSTHEQYHDRLTNMGIGDSFFEEGLTRDDVMFLVRYGKRIGVHLSAVNTDEDEVYMTPGVRVWRVLQEDLPGRKPNAQAEAATVVIPAQAVAVPQGAAGITYWMHSESESAVVAHDADEARAHASVGCDEIDREGYAAWLTDNRARRYWIPLDGRAPMFTAMNLPTENVLEFAERCREITEQDYQQWQDANEL